MPSSNCYPFSSTKLFLLKKRLMIYRLRNYLVFFFENQCLIKPVNTVIRKLGEQTVLLYLFKLYMVVLTFPK